MKQTVPDFFDWLLEQDENCVEWLKDADETNSKKSPHWLKKLAKLKTKGDKKLKQSKQ